MFCEAEVKELLTLPIVFWLSYYILSKIVVLNTLFLLFASLNRIRMYPLAVNALFVNAFEI